MTEVVYIGLGANLNEPEKTIHLAIDALSELPDCQFFGVSKIYRSAPMGPADQPDYINCVVALETSLTAATLFDHTCTIEQQHGRTRDGEHWGPRTLDLDLLLYDDIVSSQPIELPRAEILYNAFVLWPLAEVAPSLLHPVVNQSYQTLWDNYDKQQQSLWPVEFNWSA